MSADAELTRLQRAALALREMRARLDRAEAQHREPIAIVGLGCRFPGGGSPDEFWRLLSEGRDAVRECPRDRWDADHYYHPDPDRPGTVATRHGSFLERVDEFDARFFGISAREAESLDPQQRLLLEVAWEALLHAGTAPDSLRGTATGVFVGIGQNDYARRRLLAGDVEQIGPYDGTGNGFCFASGRLSYVLGLQGPNLAVDTACSASLVSVHLACQSLRLGECNLALAGGVQLMLSPEVTIFLSRARALSPDGRCRTFDASADGYGRGEGCGMIVLKRLSDAVRDGDRVYAVIRGSAVNHDGPSSGLTVPNGPAQQTVIRQALTRAGLQPDDIDYVEAHGTATALGDPIEVTGLAGVFAPRTVPEPLRIGSVKTNIGHLEAAAGIAGLIKVVLALEHGQLPPHLHCGTPNPRVPWSELPLRITRARESWTRGARTRRAGVSSFGISGTNAHVILEEPPVIARDAVRKAPLPARRWQRERFWIEPPAAVRSRPASALGLYELSWVPTAPGHEVEGAADADRYEQAERELDALSAAAAAAALRELATGAPPKHHRLLGRLRELAARDERAPVAAGEIELLTRDAARRHPIAVTEFELLGRCAGRLAPVVRGDIDPLSLLFPASGTSVASLYSQSHAADVMHRRVRAALGAIVAEHGGRPLRVLEIGAGTGSTTAALLEALPSNATYAFTDVSPGLVRQARTRFADDPRLTFHRLDVERPAADQGIADGSVDVVIAANVLHAARSLREALHHARRLLRPAGSLVLLEGTAPRAWIDLIFGLTEGWWRFADADVRASHPLIPAARWQALMVDAGFAECDAWPRESEGPAGQSVVVARCAPRRQWLVAGGAPAAGAAVVEAFARRGVSAALWTGDIDAAFAGPSGRQPAILRIGDARPDDAADATAAMHEAAAAAAMVQAVTRSGQACPIWFVTERGRPSHAPLAGFARTLALEDPGCAGGVIEIDATWPLAAEQVAGALLDNPGVGRHVAYRDGVLAVPRVTPIAASDEPRGALTGALTGTYLITGGLGALGLATAGHLATRGARHLCLLGRHGAVSSTARAAVADLQQRGVTVTVIEADVADETQMRAALDRIHRAGVPLRGVVHAAGVTGWSLLRDTTQKAWHDIMRPKVQGAWVLHRLTRALPLDFFVCYSSMVSVWGARGQGPYVAANSYLDALAHHRHDAGLPAAAINWGPLAGGGMVPESVAQELLGMGVATTAMRDAISVLDRVLDGRLVQPIAVDIDWHRFRDLYRARIDTRLFDALPLPSAPLAPRGPQPAAASTPAPAPAPAASSGLRREALLGELRTLFAKVVTLAGPVDSEAGLFDLGLDSLAAMELRRLLEQRFAITLPATLLFDTATLEGLADDLLARLGEHTDAPAPATETRRGPEPLAIVGLACRFPGAADPDAFWSLLRSGTDAIIEVPADRWNVDALYDPDPEAPGRMYTRHGGFLADVASFDAAFFGISPREAIAMDPQQRLLLETAWDALDRAGQPRDRLVGSPTGVFVGITASEYAQLQPEGLAGIDAYHITGNTLNAAAGRLAYTFGFRGPAVAVDTACSSSLVAVHLACAAIRNGDCDQAIAGGVHLILSPAGHVALSRARVLSPGGRCRTFDAEADGMARGEGCGVIVIRKLADAVRDGDPIVAIIRGSAVNQDGPSGGLTVPNGPAQEDVIRRALRNAGVAPADVSYVEAHGTATPLGDPIEVAALAAALGDGRPADAPLLVGSVKTNLGHMEAAAGIAGLLKVALSLQHGEIPPHLHFRNPSPKIPWQELPIQIVTSRRDWPRTETPRIAGVSAFGFSGTNAHVVLEEAPRPVVASGAPVDVHVMRVAARSDVAFRELAHRYADHVAAHQEDSLADICHTANTGRGDGAERGAVVAANRAELVAGLRLLAASESGPGVFRGRAAERRRIDPGVSGIADRRARLEGIAAAYVEGIVIDWASLETTGSRRKVVLPAYPWQRQRFWPSSTPAPATPASTGGSDPCAGWTYEIAWQETSTTPGTSVLTSGVALEQRMEPHLRSLRADAAMARYAAAFARLEQRAADGARAALERLAADPAASVVDAYRPLRQRLADIAASSAAEGAEPLDAVIARHPEAETEFRILDRCIAALPDVMQGRRDPLNVLFPADGASSVAYLYAESPAARVMNELLAALFGEAAAMPAPRVLEVGAGTGGTTSAVLQALSPVNPAEYVFTDVSPAFFAQAHERFAGVASLRTARLDITAPPVEQGFARGSADVVIAANVLHATPDLGRCLDHVAQLLSPGGVLVLQEWVGVSPAIDLIFGLTPGWWRFADRDLRPAHPLLPADRWRALLEAHGFEDVATLTVAPGDAGVLGRQAVLVARRKAVAARHVILGNPEGAGDRLREALIARGDEAMLVEPAQAAAEVAAAGAAHLIDLRALDTLPADDLAPATAERAAERLSADLVTLVQSLARIGAACPITIATRGALSAGGDSVDGAAQSPLWGIGRVIALEHPEIAPRLVDLDPAADPVEGLLQTLAADAAESQVAVRQGRALVPRLRPHTPVHRPAPLQFDSRGAYVISGGFGGLGLALADWLGRKGAGTVVLLGRRDPSPDAVHAIHAIGQRGTSVLPRTIDATDLDAISECLAGLRASGLRIAGVFHAAGILDDGVLLQVDGARLAAALKPKVQGAWVLHEATRGDRLDAFVLFSAATSMFGSAGQASHAAANAFLDSFAAYRRAAGLPGLSINWGAWSGIGAAAAADVAARVRMKGLQAIDPARGLAILERLMQGAAAQVGVFAADWNAIPASMKAARFVADVVGSAASLAQTSAAGKSGAVDEWHRVPAHRRRAALSDHVRHEIRRVLGLDAAAAVDMKEGLFEIGFDSLSSMDLRTRLQDTCGCVLPATLAFDCPTPDAIVAHLMPLVFPASPAQSDEAAELLSRKLAELRESLG